MVQAHQEVPRDAQLAVVRHHAHELDLRRRCHPLTRQHAEATGAAPRRPDVDETLPSGEVLWKDQFATAMTASTLESPVLPRPGGS